MKKQSKVNEPFKPEDTPSPPQQMDPSVREERNESKSTTRTNKAEERKPSDTPSKKNSGELLNEDAKIDDETTL